MDSKPYHDMTFEEQVAYGRSVHERYEGGFLIDGGRVISNVEMHASTLYVRSERRKAKQFLENEL